MATIGIISDTHGLVRPEIRHLFAQVDCIIHGGDIGKLSVIEELSTIAPIKAIRGNVDNYDWANEFPDTLEFEYAGKHFFVIHNIKELPDDKLSNHYDVIVSGHSHKPTMEFSNDTLLLNPGSAGPRRFKLPIAVALITIKGHKLTPQILEINA
ncbi:MAG: metallophosphatase family protein [Pseudomonadales bacterium]|nr:metallophosphatase family protein [Pseudomonadales bacterium]